MTRNSGKPGIFFDLDGTLVNTLSDIAGNLNQTRRHFGLKLLENQEIQGNIGRGVEHLIRSSFPEIAAADFPQVLEVMMKFYCELPFHGGEVYPGVEGVLEKLLQKGYVVGVVTNKPTEAALSTIQHYLADFPFEIIWGPEKVSAKKPHPSHLLEAIQHCKLEISQCCYVGDDEVDFLTAQAAKVSFFGAGWGFGTVRRTQGPVLEAVTDLALRLNL